VRRRPQRTGRVVRLLAAAGTLRVEICPLCAGLVLASGAEQHARVHAMAILGRDDR
jgi:hypothetical protein